MQAGVGKGNKEQKKKMLRSAWYDWQDFAKRKGNNKA